jgi:cytochrome P450
LHQKYGPIVRISPHEVHIDDPNFHSTIYTNKRGLDKPEHLKWRFGAPFALFSTPGHHIHRLRRAAQDPFFARRRILELAPMIQEKVDRMCDRLTQDFMGRNRPLTLDNLFTSYIADVTTQYSFDRDFNWLSHPEFESPFIKSIRGFKDIAHPFTQFPWLGRIMAAMPHWVVRVLQPSMASVLDFQEEMRRMIREAQNDVKKWDSGKERGPKADRTIMHGILRSGLPEEELQMEILKDQAVGLMGAGIASAQWTLTIAFFYIVNDRDVYAKLKHELMSAMPDPGAPGSLEGVLEKLPYLAACVEEGMMTEQNCIPYLGRHLVANQNEWAAVRLACGQMTRSPRISKTPTTYAQYILPPGTHISLDTWHMHHNEVLYPSSFSFIPERWLNDPRAPAPHYSGPLKHYMVSFGKGTRRCLGENLARAEITMALASLFRRFDWDLFETTAEDVRVVRDVIAPDVSRSSRGVRVLVREAASNLN